MIVNSGTIFSAAANGVNLEADTTGSIINNAGGILSGGNGHSAILSGTGEVSISNAGTINGDVSLGDAPNTVTLLTGGKINGSLNLGPNSGSTLILDGTGVETIGQAVTGTITNFGIPDQTGERQLDHRLQSGIDRPRIGRRAHRDVYRQWIANVLNGDSRARCNVERFGDHHRQPDQLRYS
jgi:hypothetical protein